MAALAVHSRTTPQRRNIPTQLKHFRTNNKRVFIETKHRARFSLRPRTYVLLLDGAFFAVVRVGDAGPAADDASTLIGAVVALVADAHQGAGPNIRIAYHALAVA